MTSPHSPTASTSSTHHTRRPSSTHRNSSSQAPAGPTRNKSSSNLSNHSNGSNSRGPKRNKSSSSLSSHSHGHGHGHGHHTIQFTHGTSGSGSNSGRRSSTGRKAAVDFGFTSLVKAAATVPSVVVQDEDDDEDEDEEDDDEAEVEEDEGDKTEVYTNRRTSSDSTLGRKDTTKEEVSLPPIVSPVQEEIRLEDPTSSRGRGRMTSRTQVLAERPEAMSYTSGSDWESAADSPAAPERNARERISRERSSRERSSRERSSGRGGREGRDGSGIRLDTSMTRMDNTRGAGVGRERSFDGNTRPSTPPPALPPLKKSGRATFQVGSEGGGEYSPISRSFEQRPIISSALLSINDSSTLAAPPSLQFKRTTSSSPPPPQPSFIVPSTTTPKKTNKPSIRDPSLPPLQPKQVFPFPASTTIEPKSPIASTSKTAYPAPPSRATRIPSSASLLSIASNRSLAHSLSVYGSPNNSRRAVGIAPALDRSSVAKAEMVLGGRDGAGSSLDPSLRTRVDSMASLRSVAGADGKGGRRATTLGSAEGKDALRRLRLAQSEGGGGGGGAIAALGNLQQRAKLPLVVETSGFSQAKRTASGYFASLRGFSSGIGNTSPLPNSPTTSFFPGGSRYSGSADGVSPTYPQQPSKGKNRLPIPSTPHVIISKFIDPPSSPHSNSVNSPRPSDSPELVNNHSGALPTMSRTQQKAFLARDAPMFWGPNQQPPLPNQSNILQLGVSTPLLLPLPPSSSTSINNSVRTQSTTEKEIGMERWISGLVKEAERVDNQYQEVQKWRDPLGESLERVLGKQVVAG